MAGDAEVDGGVRPGTDPEPGFRFDTVDWSRLEGGGGDLPADRLALLGCLVLYVGALLYDTLVQPDRPTLGPLGWDLTGVDWLFVLTLLLGAFYVGLPLYRHDRMRRYYWREFKKNRAAVASLAYLVAVFLVGTLGPVVLGPPRLDVVGAYQPPVFTTVSADVPIRCLGPVADGVCHGTWAHPLGTDAEGKDVTKLVVSGMRVSMQVGLITTLIIITIATVVGTSAAYFGGMVDEVLMRYVDLQLTFPTFFLFLLLVYLFGGSLFLLIVIFGVTSWGGVARLVRSEALQRSEEAYVRASESAGASEWWIIRRHIVPNVSNTIITATTLTIPFLILAEAGLSFLGLGDPTVASWGRTIAAGRGDLATAWWIATLPGVFLFGTVLAFNFLGDALRDALDPRQEA